MTDDLTPPTPEPMGDGATFDLSNVTPTDVPYIGPAPDDDVPDHSAGDAIPPLDAPPTIAGRKRGKREKREKPIPPKRRGALVKPLENMYASVGMMLAPFDQACSMAVLNNARTCAESLDNLAQSNDAVRRVLLAMTETSAWGGVMIAHLPLLLVITAHHGPPEVADRVAPLAMMMNAQSEPGQEGPAA